MADAIAIAYTYLNRRERTVAEVRARLEKAECGETEIAAAIEELLELGTLDDVRYARLFVEDRRSLDGWGRERIMRSLSERGIDRDVAAAAVSEGPEEKSELDRAVDLLTHRFAVPADEPRERERAYAVLIRKGYESEVAADAVKTWVRR